MKTRNKVILGFVITGLCVMVLGFCLNGAREMATVFHQEGNFWGWRSFATKDVTEEFNNIDSLNIEVNSAKVNIIEYEQSTIRVDARQVSKKAKIEERNGTLNVIDESFGISFGFGWFYDDMTIDVYIPHDYTFSTVVLDVDAGSINIEKLETNRLTVDVDAGKVKGEHVLANTTKADVDAGVIDFEYLDGEELSFDVDAGTISALLAGKEEDYSYRVSCDVGSVKVGNYRTSGISSKDRGGYGSKRIEANCDAGTIKIKMEG